MKNIVISILIFAPIFLTINTLHADSHRASKQKFLLEDKTSYLKHKEPKRGDVNAKILLYKNILVVEFVTPVYNIHGVDTAPNLRSEDEKTRVEKAKEKFLASPEKFISFAPKEACTMSSFGYRLEQADTGAKQAEPHVGKWRHFDVRAELLFICDDVLPERMIVNLFKITPNFEEIHAQFIAHNSDVRHVVLKPKTPVLEFTRSSNKKTKN